MLLKEKTSGHIVEVLNIIDLCDSARSTVRGRLHYGEEAQDPDRSTSRRCAFFPVRICRAAGRTRIIATRNSHGSGAAKPGQDLPQWTRRSFAEEHASSRAFSGVPGAPRVGITTRTCCWTTLPPPEP